jgi:dTDP-4-amino-4,6-dideoxygalactose transaminase
MMMTIKIPDTVGEPTIPFYWPPAPSSTVFMLLEHQWRNGIYTKGDTVAQLAQEFADFLNVDHVILTSSGTMALAVGTMAAIKIDAIHEHPRILVPAYTWESVPYAIGMAGGDVTFGDIDLARWHLDHSWEHNQYNIHHATCVTETFGARVKSLPEKDFFVDAAHSMGLPKIGGRGLFEAFSLAATKVVTGGEGGVITTFNHELALAAKQIARYVGRLPEASAILALDSLQNIDASLRWRKEIADAYHKHLGSNVIYQDTKDGTNNYVFPVRLNADQAARLRQRRDFAVRQYYNPPLDTFKENATKVASSVVCLPQVSPGVCEHVANVIIGKEECE